MNNFSFVLQQQATVTALTFSRVQEMGRIWPFVKMRKLHMHNTGTHTHTKEGSGFSIYFVLRLPITSYVCAHGVSAPISFICHIPRTSQPYLCHGTLEELH